MEVDSEKDCVIVYGVVGHTEFRCDGVCSESVLGDFPETIVGNCVLLQHVSNIMTHLDTFVRGRRADKTLRLVGFDSAEEQLMPNRSRV